MYERGFMGTIGILAWVVPVFFVGFILSCVWVVLRCVFPPLGVPAHPSCGKCNYAVEGQTSMTCPECGSDYRTVGISTRLVRMKGRARLPMAIAAWVFLVSLGTGVAYAWFTLENSFFVTRYNSAIPVSGTFSLVECWISDGRSREHPYMLMVRITNTTGQSILELELSTREMLILDTRGNVVTRSKYDGQASVAQLLAAAGVDPRRESATPPQSSKTLKARRSLFEQAKNLLGEPHVQEGAANEASEIDSFIAMTIKAPQGSHGFEGGILLQANPPTSGPLQPQYQMLRTGVQTEYIVVAVGSILGVLGVIGLWQRRRILLHRAAAQ